MCWRAMLYNCTVDDGVWIALHRGFGRRSKRQHLRDAKKSPARGGALMQGFCAWGRLSVQQLFDHPDHSHPHRLPFQVPSLGPIVGLRGGEDGHGRRTAVAQTDGTIWVRSVKGS